MSKARGVPATRAGATRGNRLAGGRSQSGPIDLSFSNYGRNGFERGGLSVGSDGVRAYYDRQRYGYRDRGGYGYGGGGDYYGYGYGHGFGYGFGYYPYSLHASDYYLGSYVGLYGGFYSGIYYPYGYASAYDTYYHRYPYNYVTVYDSTPSWTVYVEQPVDRVVYVDSSAGAVTSGAPEVLPSDVAFEGPPPAAGGSASASGSREVEVQPQERIPVHNAWLATGETEFREGNYEAAVRSFAYAVLEEPANGFANLAYGLVHFAQGDYDAAADAIRRGLSAAPDIVDRPIDITRVYGDSEDLTAHVQKLQLHLAARPDDASGWFVLGYVEYSSGHPERAARAFSKAASLNPNDSHAAVLRDAARRVTETR